MSTPIHQPIPNRKPKASTGWGTRGMRTTPAGGMATPPINRTEVEAKARKNLLMTSSRRIKTLGRKSAFGGGKWQQRNATRPFDGGCQQPLMSRTVAGDSAWGHLAPLSNELRDRLDILIVDSECLIGAETTYLTPKHRTPARRSLFVVSPFASWSCPHFPLRHVSNSPCS